MEVGAVTRTGCGRWTGNRKFIWSGPTSFPKMERGILQNLENNGMAPDQDDERLWHCHTCDKRTVIEGVHA